MASRTLFSLEDYARLPNDGRLHELSEGELVLVTHPRFRHMVIAQNLNEALSAAAKVQSHGRVFSEMAFLLGEDPPTLRIPDVCFLASSRLSAARPDEYLRGAPELAVEVVSPSDLAEDIEQKTMQYLRAGAHAVWVVYPKTKTVHVFQPGRTPQVLDESSRLEAPDLLPGWSLPIALVFDGVSD